MFEISWVGSGWEGLKKATREGSGHPGPNRPARSGPTREKTRKKTESTDASSDPFGVWGGVRAKVGRWCAGSTSREFQTFLVIMLFRLPRPRAFVHRVSSFVFVKKRFLGSDIELRK